MTVINKLKVAAKRAGVVLEEDHDSLDTRNFQLVAPKGKRWKSTGVQCQPIVIAKRPNLPSAIKFNEVALKDALDIIKAGLEDIPANEEDFYAED